MMKPLVIYHASCADGFGAAFAAWLKLGDDAEYVPVQYGDIEAPVNLIGMFGGLFTEREVYILDFSFPKEVMDWVFSNAKRVVWLDHHKTAFEMWCGKYEKEMSFFDDPINSASRHYILLDDNKSGAYLAWEYFHPGTEVPMFIQHLDDYDRWQFKMEGTKAFQKALWSYAPWSFEQWKDMLLLVGFTGEEGGYNFYESGSAILRAHDQNVQSVVKGSARKCEISVNVAYPCEHDPLESVPPSASDGYIRRFAGLAANCPPHLQSDVGHELANQSGTFGLLWFVDKDNRCKCSLRSNGDYDVSAIAKSFGGGGHRNAAGFTIDTQTLLGWMK